ncbi:MAG: class I SAM-dependent methyltransferase [Burkholderiales bacterium]
MSQNMPRADRVLRLGSDLRLLVQSIARYGVSRTITLIQASVYYRVCQIQGRRLDARLGVNTSQLLHLDALTTSDGVTRGCNYVGSAPGIVRHAFGLLPRPPGELSLVDLGCGSGRVLMLAAEAGFKEVIGWEIAQELIDAGLANLERFRQVTGNTTPVRIERVDATRAPLPDGPCVLHFFSPPYRDPVLQACLENAHRSYLARPRDLFVILVNDHDRALTDDFPFLTRVEPSRATLTAALLRRGFSVNVWRIR